MSRAKPEIYLNNKDLYEEACACKETGIMSDKLARMLQLLVSRYARKPNYIAYTYNEDMQAYAMMMFVTTWSKFDTEKYSNAFAYYTTCVHNSFSQFLNKEKTQREIRDGILLDQGMSPSFTYSNDHSKQFKPTED